ncbi:MAG: S9 family peptidase [Bacteroidales bacterium]|nr:S9 family peptidase [Bacteroidales bacterium]
MKKSIICSIMMMMFALVSANTSTDYLKGFTSGEYRAKTPDVVRPMADGEHYTIISADKKSIVAYDYATGKTAKTIFSLEGKNCPLKTIEGYDFSQNEKTLLIHGDVEPIYRRSFITTYYVVDVERGKIEPLTKNGGEMMARLSPNGRMVAFSKDNNMFIKKLDYGTELQITKDGEKNHIINGTADWVYEEEFATTRYFEWSTDGQLLAYLKFDESDIEEYSFDVFQSPYTKHYTYKYPKAGTNNSTVRLYVYDVANRTTKKIDTGDGDYYLPILTWTSDKDQLALAKLNRNQTELILYNVNARSGVTTPIFTEKGENRYADYQVLDYLHFNSDNSFVCMSERDGYRHLYLFRPNGQVSRQITKGEWDVITCYGYDESTATTYFQAAKERPYERHIYKINSKGIITNLDPRDGIHSADFSTNFKYAISQFNNATTPNIYTVINNNGKEIRVVENNQTLADKMRSMNLPKKEFFSFTTEDGILLYAWIVKPNNFDSRKQYPLVMVQYSGPNSQEVLNRWKPDWEYYLAQEGYIVACVDGRGTGARGTKFRTASYKKLGQVETHDQIAAAHYFGKLNYIDSERIAIWGWSYGGFMALNCLINGNGTFKTGIAVAPVTDWHLYNTAYTERFMTRPQENAKGYDISNLIKQASKLQGNLLIVHGTADDNVHIQNTFLFTEALTQAGIPYSQEVYTNKNHSILGAKTRLHLYTSFNNFLKANL